MRRSKADIDGHPKPSIPSLSDSSCQKKSSCVFGWLVVRVQIGNLQPDWSFKPYVRCQNLLKSQALYLAMAKIKAVIVEEVFFYLDLYFLHIHDGVCVPCKTWFNPSWHQTCSLSNICFTIYTLNCFLKQQQHKKLVEKRFLSAKKNVFVCIAHFL